MKHGHKLRRKGEAAAQRAKDRKLRSLAKPHPDPGPQIETPPAPFVLPRAYIAPPAVEEGEYEGAPEIIVLTPEEMQNWHPPQREKGKPMYSDPRVMAVGIEKYFKKVSFNSETTNPPTLAGLALACGFVTKGALAQYAKKPGFDAMIKRACLKVEEFWEARLSGKQSSGATAWLQNNPEIKYTDHKAEVMGKGVGVLEDMLGAIHEARAKRGNTAPRTLPR